MRKQNENKNIVTKQETMPVRAILITRRAQRKCLKHTQNGITLVALVITIIVLLILTGVTINLTLGERGIFGLAKNAKEKQKNAEELENSILHNYEQKVNNYLNEQNTLQDSSNEQEKNKVTITYDKNCEEATGEMKITEINKGTDVKLIANEFQRDGYSFVNWNTKEDGTGESYENEATIDTLNEDIKLYAIWIKRVYIFNNGDLCKDITGGWSVGAVHYENDFSNCNASIGNTLSIFSPDKCYNRYLTVITTNNIIDISKYKKMVIDVEFDAGHLPNSFVGISIYNNQITKNNSNKVILSANSDSAYVDKSGNTCYPGEYLWSTYEVESSKSEKNAYNFYSMFGAKLHTYGTGRKRVTEEIDLTKVMESYKYYTTQHLGLENNPKHIYNYLKGRIYFRVISNNYSNFPQKYQTSGSVYSIRFE